MRFCTSHSLLRDADISGLWTTLSQAQEILRGRGHSPSGSRTASTRLGKKKKINEVFLKSSHTLHLTRRLSKKAYPFYSLILYYIMLYSIITYICTRTHVVAEENYPLIQSGLECVRRVSSLPPNGLFSEQHHCMSI